MEIKLEKASECDAQTIIGIRNECFYEDYISYGECPGYNIPLEQMINRIKEGHLYLILADNETAGDISVKILENGVHWIGCVSVSPKHQNKGIGSLAMKEIESLYPKALIWQLDTPLSNERNCHFYEKLGFCVIGTKEISSKLTLGVFEKRVEMKYYRQ